jgi:hypothetical protein
MGSMFRLEADALVLTVPAEGIGADYLARPLSELGLAPDAAAPVLRVDAPPGVALVHARRSVSRRRAGRPRAPGAGARSAWPAQRAEVRCSTSRAQRRVRPPNRVARAGSTSALASARSRSPPSPTLVSSSG